MFEQDLELKEKVFHRLGYKNRGGWWDKPNGTVWLYSPEELPPIETSWEVCAEFLVPFMRGEYYRYRITSLGTFAWEPILDIKDDDCEAPKAEIHNDNIVLAACKAFIEVEL